MEVRLTLITRSSEADVVVRAAAGTRVGGLLGPGPLWAGRPVEAGDLLGVPPLVDGARVWVGALGSAWPALGAAGLALGAAGPRQLRVVGGPDAGLVVTLGCGELVVGRSGDLCLSDHDVSRAHAVVDARPDGVWVRDAGSTNGTWLDGAEVGGDFVPLPPDALLRCGASLLVHTPPTDPPAVVRPDGAGGLGFSRPPRLRPAPGLVEVVFPCAPPEPSRFRFPWVMVVAPLLIGLALWLVTGGQTGYLLLTLLSPVLFGANALSDRIGGRRDHRRALASYAVALESATQERDAALAAETAARRAAAPDPASVLLTVLGPGSRLWERRPDDDDALRIRVGLADQPARLVVRGAAAVPGRAAVPGGAAVPGRAAAQGVVAAVPVTVALGEVGVLGIAGPAGTRRRLARWLIAQLAALHPPRDLRFVLLTEDRGYGWFRWLPHAVPLAGAAMAWQGVGAEQVATRVAELAALLDNRQRCPEPEPSIVLILDGAERLRQIPGVARLLVEGPAVGIVALCLAADPLELPEECGAVAVLDQDGGPSLRLAVGGCPPVPDITADLVAATWIDQVARGLAPIRDTTPDVAGGSLPTQIRLLDLVRDMDPAELWRTEPRSTRTVLGCGVDGPVTVDLRADGPHALVAGTTGAGKSELLQALVAGLALANRPDELAFILVDYKGGAAFAECARLPHTVGMVTDLDAHLTARALTSLAAELRRRERLLAAADAADLDAYQAAGRRLARLVIVIDEFASLIAELPDFVTGLVDLARRGRSLGIHLVMATQRPAGVVSSEIRANTALRICLRVADAAESADVIDAPDAARISQRTPGRAFARLAGRLVAVQTARVGGRAVAASECVPVVEPAPWQAAGAPRAVPERHVADETDLAQLVRVVRAAAESAGATAPPSPWLPALPGLVTVEELPVEAGFRIPLGLHDLPAEQRRTVHALDLADGGHLLVAGGSRSGRTSALRTIGAGIGALPVADAHLYVLDCGGGLAGLAALPHCGAVVPRDDTERGARLLDRLGVELTRRQGELASGGFGSVAEQRAGSPPDNRLPWLVLLVDSWEGFLHAYEGIDHGRLVDQLTRLLRDGGTCGLRVVVSGDRGLLAARVAALASHRLVLRMADPDSYGLAGIRSAPARLAPGRALVPNGEGGATEVQIALLDRDPSGSAQVAAIQRVAAEAAAEAQALPRVRRGRQVPFRLRALPEHVSLASLADAGGSAEGPLWIPFGIGGDDAAPLGLDLAADGPGALIVGPPGSGRSTALRTAAIQHLSRGGSVAVVAAGCSPVMELAGTTGVLGVFGADDELLAAVATGPAPLLVVVDDAERLLDTAADAAVCRILAEQARADRAATDRPCGVLVAGESDALHSIYRGCTVEVRRSRSGLLLGQSGPLDGDLLGVRLSRGIRTRAGRGVLVRRGTATPIQLATTETREVCGISWPIGDETLHATPD